MSNVCSCLRPNRAEKSHEKGRVVKEVGATATLSSVRHVRVPWLMEGSTQILKLRCVDNKSVDW